MADSLEPEFITKDHYEAFGRIIQAFANVDALYSRIITRTLEVPDATAGFLMASYAYDSLKNLVKTILSETTLPETERDEGLKLIEKINDKAVLRNNVAHTIWTPGKRPGSIKPMVLKTKGTLKILGVSHNEKDWLASELHAEAEEILARIFAVGAFFMDRGVDIANVQQRDDQGLNRQDAGS